MLRPVGCSITRITLRNVPISNLVHLPRRTLPNLERLILVIVDKLEYWQFDRISHGPIKAFLDCPLLRYVALGRYFREPGHDFIQLPLRQLTHFIDVGPFHESEKHSYLSLARVLSTGKNLRLLHFSADDDCRAALPHNIANAKFTIPCLESLSFESNFRFEDDDIFGIFSFPNLRSLRYSGYLRQLEQFLRAGKAEKLEHLSIKAEVILPAAFVTLLSEHAPKLTSLEVGYGSAEILLETLGATVPRSLPELRVLSLRCAIFKEEDETTCKAILTAIRAFVDNRVEDGRPCSLRVINLIDGVRDSLPAGRFYTLLLECCRTEPLNPTVVLNRIEGFRGIMGPPELDPELAGWEGLEELSPEGRVGWLLYGEGE